MSPDCTAFDQLVQAYYDAWFRYHPEQALGAGRTEYAGLLAPIGDDVDGALISLNEKLLADLDALDREALDPDRRIDYDLLKGQASIQHHELLETGWRRRDPLRYLPIAAIHQLTLYPVPDLRDAMLARLAAFPDSLRAARAQLAEMPELVPQAWVQAAIKATDQGVRYLRDLPGRPTLQHAFPKPTHLRALLELAVDALHAYRDFLCGDLRTRARGDFSCEREHYDRLLAWRHFLPVATPQLLELGERIREQARDALHAGLSELRGDTDVQAFVAELGRQAPAERPMHQYRDQLLAAKRFVLAHGLASAPADEALDLCVTPESLREQIPDGYYLPPLDNAAPPRGRLFLAPDSWCPDVHPECTAHAALVSVQAGWPGRHLQSLRANESSAGRSLPRRINASSTLSQGWALYCEELMSEQGFLQGREIGVLLLRERLWLALRLCLDVKIHTEKMGLEEAADLLRTELGVSAARAHAEVTWYSRAPTEAAGVAAGWASVRAARSCWDGQRPAPDLCEFHDRLLAVGSIGAGLALRRAFGDKLARSVHNELFTPSGVSHL